MQQNNVASLRGPMSVTQDLLNLRRRKEELHDDEPSVFFFKDSEKVELVPRKTVKIGKYLALEVKKLFIEFLRATINIFAWTLSDMPDIDPKVLTYKLQVNPSIRPIQQKR